MKKLISPGERFESNGEPEEAIQTESISEVWPKDVFLPEAEPMPTFKALRARAECTSKVLEDILRLEPTVRAAEEPK